jgi:hypothetical protein
VVLDISSVQAFVAVLGRWDAPVMIGLVNVVFWLQQKSSVPARLRLLIPSLVRQMSFYWPRASWGSALSDGRVSC